MAPRLPSLRRHLAELEGYLQAVADLNDQVGHRVGAWVRDHSWEDGPVATLIRRRYGDALADALVPLDRRGQTRLLDRLVLRNAPALDPAAPPRTPGLRETLVWRIEEFLSLEHCGRPVLARYHAGVRREASTDDTIVIVTTRRVICVFFHAHDECPRPPVAPPSASS